MAKCKKILKKKGLQYNMSAYALSCLPQIIDQARSLVPEFLFYPSIALIQLVSISCLPRFNLPSPLGVEVLHLDGGRRHSETEVFVGSDVRHADWFVLDVASRYRLVLMQVKRTRHGF